MQNFKRAGSFKFKLAGCRLRLSASGGRLLPPHGASARGAALCHGRPDPTVKRANVEPRRAAKGVIFKLPPGQPPSVLIEGARRWPFTVRGTETEGRQMLSNET